MASLTGRRNSRPLVAAFQAAVALSGTVAIGGMAASGARQPAAPICGRVVAVSCTGPSSAVNLLLALPSPGRNVTVVIPAEHRSLFGSRVEDRFDQRQICVALPSPAVDGGDQSLTVRSTDRLVVTGDSQPPSRLPDDVYRTCDADVQLPIVLNTVVAQYTSDAMRAKVEGRVVVQGIVDRDGVVHDVRVLQRLEPSLDEGAQRALAQWTFRPATHMGQPVAMAITVEMAFTLH
jgi:TonB family protein